jgi:two-component system KDP operon response regulator KdpE
MSMRILVIDDEPQIRKFLRISLSANGYEVSEAENARKGIEAAISTNPDLLIVDLGLPDMEGHEVITFVRDRGMQIPIIVLSVRSQELDKVEALDRGANDYVVKPFGVAELMARIRAVLRRSQGKEALLSLDLGHVHIDLAKHVVTKDGNEIHLSKKEWDLLVFLAKSPDHVLTHKHILREVWGRAHVEDTSYLRVYINQLRQKLENDPAQPALIVTDPGVGYRIKPSY